MSILVSFQFPQALNVPLLGDGTTIEVSLSYSKLPFPDRLPGKPVGGLVTAYGGALAGNSASLTFGPNKLKITFSAAFSGFGNLALDLYCDPE